MRLEWAPFLFLTFGLCSIKTESLELLQPFWDHEAASVTAKRLRMAKKKGKEATGNLVASLSNLAQKPWNPLTLRILVVRGDGYS